MLWGGVFGRVRPKTKAEMMRAKFFWDRWVHVKKNCVFQQLEMCGLNCGILRTI